MGRAQGSRSPDYSLHPAILRGLCLRHRAGSHVPFPEPEPTGALTRHGSREGQGFPSIRGSAPVPTGLVGSTTTAAETAEPGLDTSSISTAGQAQGCVPKPSQSRDPSHQACAPGSKCPTGAAQGRQGTPSIPAARKQQAAQSGQNRTGGAACSRPGAVKSWEVK